jgi:hypothetical protein
MSRQRQAPDLTVVEVAARHYVLIAREHGLSRETGRFLLPSFRSERLGGASRPTEGEPLQWSWTRVEPARPRRVPPCTLGLGAPIREGLPEDGH